MLYFDTSIPVPGPGGWRPSRRAVMFSGAAAAGVVALAAASPLVLGRVNPVRPSGPEPGSTARLRDAAVLIDVTDPFTANQLQFLSTGLRAYAERLPAGDQISADLLLSSEQAPLRRMLAGVKPRSGATANPLIENPRLMDTDYDAFLARFDAAVAAAGEIKRGTQPSPIVEAIWVRAQRGPIDDLTLWSDMVNHSATVNHFRSKFAKFDASSTRNVALTQLGSLRGARVSVYQLAINVSHQTAKLRAWWDGYWAAAGVADVKWTRVPA